MRLGKKKTKSEQDAEQEQKETSKRTDKQEQEPDQEEDTGTEQGSDEEAEQTGEAEGSLKQILEMLKQADLINTDASLKSLVKEGKLVPPKEWGILMASGHWLLIWRRKGL